MKRLSIIIALILSGCVQTDTTLPDGTRIKTNKPDTETVVGVAEVIITIAK